VRIAYDRHALRATQEEIRIEDGRLRAGWGDRLYRILLRAEGPPAEAQWVLRIGQA
jgi:hypothetical protein